VCKAHSKNSGFIVINNNLIQLNNIRNHTAKTKTIQRNAASVVGTSHAVDHNVVVNSIDIVYGIPPKTPIPQSVLRCALVRHPSERYPWKRSEEVEL